MPVLRALTFVAALVLVSWGVPATAADDGSAAVPAGLLQASRARFGRFPFMKAEDVHAKIVRGGDNAFFLASVQTPEEFAKGHVPGAINIPVADLAKPESLAKLPRDRKIVLVCYIGHWAGSAALFLNQLGYEAVDMRFGTLGWNDETEGLGGAKDYLRALGGSLELPVEKGTGR